MDESTGLLLEQGTLGPSEIHPKRGLVVLRRAAVAVAGFAAIALMLSFSSSSSSKSPQSGAVAAIPAAPSTTTSLDIVEKSPKKLLQPHIILFTIDDMGWNDIGYESSDLPGATEFMTKLAQKSIRLTQYYGQPSCTPSRATMMTGRWAHVVGFQNYELQARDFVGVPLSFKLLPELMRDRRYKTHGLGKWNIGFCNVKYMPQERGFESFLGYNCPGHGYYDHICTPPSLSSDMLDMFESWSEQISTGEWAGHWKTGKEYQGTYDTLLYKERAAKIIRRHAAEYGSHNENAPLFMWDAMHGIHSEGDKGPEPPHGMISDDNREYLNKLRASIDEAESNDEKKYFFKQRLVSATVLMSIDNTLKHLVDTLQEVGMWENTVLFVHADNGASPKYNVGHPGNNFPLRGEKFMYFEGGVRVPAFLHAPWLENWEIHEGREYKGLMHHVDLLTTFASLAGYDVKALKSEHQLDGFDMMHSIIDTKKPAYSPRDEIVFDLPRDTSWKVGDPYHQENYLGAGAVIRLKNYKLMIGHTHDGWFSPDVDSAWWSTSDKMADTDSQNDYFYSADYNRSHWLFDVVNDPTERDNLWFSDDADIKKIRHNLIERVEALTEDSGNYGKIVYQMYMRSFETSDDKQTAKFNGTSYKKVWKENGDYITPYGCAAIE